MIDKDKIILMSKLAIYDKKYGICDKKRNEYFKRDYVYKQNFGTRIGASIGGIIIFMFYMCNKIIINSVDIFSIDINTEIRNFLFFMVSLLGIYTVIGWLIASYDYNISQARLKKYFKLMDQLEKVNIDNMQTNNKEEYRYSHGSDIYDEEFFNKSL